MSTAEREFHPVAGMGKVAERPGAAMDQHRDAVETWPVQAIVFREDLYPRTTYDHERANEYAANLERLPPIEVNAPPAPIRRWPGCARNPARWRRRAPGSPP